MSEQPNLHNIRPTQASRNFTAMLDAANRDWMSWAIGRIRQEQERELRPWFGIDLAETPAAAATSEISPVGDALERLRK